MRSVPERLERIRWMAMPLTAYLVITLALPLANAGTMRREFVHHAGWVLAGCAFMIGIAIAGGLVVEIATYGVRRLTNKPRSRSVGGRS